jgi:septal ring factor EnvC (AmiA/AmiB activator)
MLEPLLVDRPMSMPFACVFCGSQKDGPFTLWHVEIRPHGMLFSCARCAREDAMRRGFIASERAEELRITEDERKALEDVNSDYAKQIKDLLPKVKALNAEVESLHDDVAQRDGRIEQLEARLRERAEADLALTVQNAA